MPCLKQQLLLLGLLMISVFLVACGSQPQPSLAPSPEVPTTSTATVAPTPTGAAPAQAEVSQEYTITVVYRGKALPPLTVAVIKQLPRTTPEGEGGEEGATLLSVLKIAGVQEFDRVTVIGLTQGRRGPATLILAKAEVTDAEVIGITGRGTTKLFSSRLPKDQWVIDVARIEVE